MSKRFYLFGEKAFDVFALETFAGIKHEVERITDIEILMYKDNFEELLQKMMELYSFNAVNISFDNQIVDLNEHHNNSGKTILAEYSLIVSGNYYYLGLIPHHNISSKNHLPVVLRGNVLSFEIDTQYHDENFPTAVRSQVKREYDAIKKFINDSVYNMELTIKFYNAELEKFLIPLLANRLRKAEKSYRIKESLNFK